MGRLVKTFSAANPTTRLAYEEYLNESGIPEEDKVSNGGRIPASIIYYGTWLRINDPITFNARYNDWIKEANKTI